MITLKVDIDIPNIAEFVQKAETIVEDTILVQDNYTVSAKSLMGIMTLDLGRNLKLYVYDRDDEDTIKSIFSDFLKE